MPMSSRVKAFVAYLFLAVGGIVVLLVSRRDAYAAFHARQSIALTLVAVVGSAVLMVICYLVALIPRIGPPLGMAAFALVIGLLLALLFAWVKGMLNALRAKVVPAPVVGAVASRWLGA